MRVAGLTIDPQTKTPMAILRQKNNDVVLPVWLGALEAMSISMAMNRESQPRPLTHDLLLLSLEALGACLDCAQITGLEDGVYEARLILQTSSGQAQVTCRPSDAIALSLRANARLMVSRAVLARAAEAQYHVQERLHEENLSVKNNTRPAACDTRQSDNNSTDEKYRRMLHSLEPISPRKM